ncbi:MAG: glycosyltransferase family 39 protein, partial [Acidimicrobiales bacterium]
MSRLYPVRTAATRPVMPAHLRVPCTIVSLTVVEAPSAQAGDLRRTLFGEARRVHPVLLGAGVVAILAGVALRFWAPSPLWLDETISVNISRLPLTEIPRALSHDGAPPLYYYLLHFWMDVFGQGDFAVRALSGLASVVALPVFWFAGRRLGGRHVAWVTFFLALTSPFAIDYATNTRMYSLMILWSVLGYLALCRAIERPTRGRLVALGAVTAALLYTHYWGLYL